MYRWCLSLVTVLMLISMVAGTAGAQKAALMQEDVSFVNTLKHGSVLNATTLNAAITAIGSAERTLFMSTGAWTLAANVTVPRNIRLWVPKGTTVAINSGITLTLNGPLVADEPSTWWSGAGTLTLNFREWSGDGISSFIASGCTPTVPSPGSLTFDAFACVGHIVVSSQVTPVYQAAAAGGPLNAGNGTYWLALRRDTVTVPALWTCQAGTHYCWIVAVSEPTTPAGTLIFAQVTVAAGSITAVRGMAARNPAVTERDCTRYPGANVGEQLRACIDSLPSNGGIANGRGFTGSLIVNVDIFANSLEKPLTLLLGPGGYTFNVSQTLPTGLILECAGRYATSLVSGAAVPLLTRTYATQTESFVDIGHCTLQGNSLGTIGIFSQLGANFYLHDLDIAAFTTAGIQVRGGLIFQLERLKVYNNPLGLDVDWVSGATNAPNFIGVYSSRFINNSTYAISAAHMGMLVLHRINNETNGTAGNAATGGINISGTCPVGEGHGLHIQHLWSEGDKGHSGIRIGAPVFVTCQHVIQDSIVFGGTRTFGLHIQPGGITIDYVVERSTFQNASTADIRDDNDTRRGVFLHSLAGTKSLGNKTTEWPNTVGTASIIEKLARDGTATFVTTALVAQAVAGYTVTLDSIGTQVCMTVPGFSDSCIGRASNAPGQFNLTPSTVFANLGTFFNSFGICSDCGMTNPGVDNTCAGGGPGAFYIRIAGVNRCFNTQN